MAGKIFLNYRRDDAGWFAQALFGQLERSFLLEDLFMDVQGDIGAGQNFVRRIQREVELCDVMLVLIGPNWLAVNDENGRPRLDNAQDLVRIEIESALRHGKHIIPVLERKTEMPLANALPKRLKSLADKHAVRLTLEDFKTNAQELIKAIEGARAEAAARRQAAATKAALAKGWWAAEQTSLLSDFIWMALGVQASAQRNKLVMLAVALVAVVGATAYMQIRLNAWNGPFYNALTHKDTPVFVEQLGVFAELAGMLLVLNVAQMWLNQISKVVLRQGLVNDLLNEWLKPVRAFRLSNSGAIGANPDQRLQADAQHLTDLSMDLGVGLLQSTLLLLSFISVLWALSRGMFLPFAGHMFAPPGYLVWCALIYAGAASLLSWRVGRPLIDLNSEHYAREADFRFSLVHVSENLDGITLYRGEADERWRLDAIFETVLGVSRRIVGAVTRLTWVTAGYGWFTIVAPILVAAPAYLRSDMSFGELMVVVGAFNQVQNSLRWFVDNFSNIADWRATLQRVATFRQAISTMDELGQTASRIELDEAEDQSILIDDLRVASPAGSVMLSETHSNLDPGERVLITGANGEEKALLFRAIGGLWPWGSGRITHPIRRSIMFMPVRAYVPSGTLRAAVAYPHSTEDHETSVITKALADVGLENLEPLLDKVERWDRRLTEDEKQRLAFARVILQRPLWVVVNGALDVLDPKSRIRIRALFANELADVGLINIGDDQPETGFYGRKLHLETDPDGPSFKPAQEHGIPEPPRPAREPLAAQ